MAKFKNTAFRDAVIGKPERSESGVAAGYETAAAMDGKVLLSLPEINLCRQWFAAVQDINPQYLQSKDYILAAKLFEACGMRVPNSISKKCS